MNKLLYCDIVMNRCDVGKGRDAMLMLQARAVDLDNVRCRYDGLENKLRRFCSKTFARFSLLYFATLFHVVVVLF